MIPTPNMLLMTISFLLGKNCYSAPDLCIDYYREGTMVRDMVVR
jgi:hypothetical protein